MRYSRWVEQVFAALVQAGGTRVAGVSLSAVGDKLGFEGLAYEDFAQGTGVAGALMSAMSELQDLGWARFVNVAYGCSVAESGLLVEEHGFEWVHAEVFDKLVSERQLTMLARLYRLSATDGEGWADMDWVEVSNLADEGDEDKAVDVLARLSLSGLVRERQRTFGSIRAFSPTYAGALLLTESDPRSSGRAAGVIDWSVATPGFDDIEERIAQLKARLAAAETEDDLSDVGRRCVDIAADAVAVVFRNDMVPKGGETPSPQDTAKRMDLYLAATAPGQANEKLRRFIKSSLVLAESRKHSSDTGYVGAVASAQALLALVRTIQSVERRNR